MMISDRLAKAISDQVGREFHASHQYLTMAAYFERENLPQLATFFYRQSEEEREHGMKLARYVSQAGGQVEIPAVPAPAAGFPSVEAAIQTAVNWELEVTRQIHDLVRLAQEERDYLADNFLRWFVDEQLEEVTTMETLAATARRAGDNLLLLENAVARMIAS